MYAYSASSLKKLKVRVQKFEAFIENFDEFARSFNCDEIWISIFPRTII